MLGRALILVAAGAVAVALAVGGASEPLEPPEANLAPCDQAAALPAPVGDWSGAVTAGPVTVDAAPLRSMRQAANGQLYARTQALVSGHRFVVVSVPLELRKRVFLYFGQVLDNRGGTPTSLFRAPGYAETELQPCRHRSRTVWSGGIRVIGKGPVSLLVTVEGATSSIPLRLGRPAVAAPST